MGDWDGVLNGHAGRVTLPLSSGWQVGARVASVEWQEMRVSEVCAHRERLRSSEIIAHGVSGKRALGISRASFNRFVKRRVEK